MAACVLKCLICGINIDNKCTIVPVRQSTCIHKTIFILQFEKAGHKGL